MVRQCKQGTDTPFGSFTLADPDSDPYSDSDSCTIQILRERDPDPNLNECEKF